MTDYLRSSYFPAKTEEEDRELQKKLNELLESDFDGNMFAMLSDYQSILADNQRRLEWPLIHAKLQTLFKCGKGGPLDGPMVGIPVSIRDSDYFKDTVELFGKERSLVASIEWMATAWNETFADTGLWMGKTYEPVSRELVEDKTNHDADELAKYDPATTRIGRNFFREPPDPNLIQGLGLPTLTKTWHLRDRPKTPGESGFFGSITEQNLDKEKAVPYSKTGGIFIANMGNSVVPEMNGKTVYQLNYRWPKLDPAYPMTRLIDEVVQIGEGIYLGQLVLATKHYALGSFDLPFVPGEQRIPVGEPYAPNQPNFLQRLLNRWFNLSLGQDKTNYGYQNNGFFLMMDPAYAKQIYADDAFPQLRPRSGEVGFKELGYAEEVAAAKVSAAAVEGMEWKDGWRNDAALKEKFTTFILEPSPNESDPTDIESMRREDESILQMLKRISQDISNQTRYEDHLKHFEQLHVLFRAGVAPSISNGLFQGRGHKGYNTRVNGREKGNWYGETERAEGFDYYHGATLNLHWGFSETFLPDLKGRLEESFLFPAALSSLMKSSDLRGPNFMNMIWHSIGKYIFPWAGKSFERISPRKLSMLLDESDDLGKRYPARVKELKNHLASAPHYDLVRRNRKHYWKQPGKFDEHLRNGSWDDGMKEEDKIFWQNEADNNWVYGTNLQDRRILNMDAILRIVDMNYRVPDASLQAVSEQSGSPFMRQGYIFLGNANQESILPMNSGEKARKKVFQFNYRYPMIGGATPIGFCLDELVELADGLFLGQLIYSTALHVPFHSSEDPAEYKYQLFGYFLLLDDAWERHRQAIGLDTLEHRLPEKRKAKPSQKASEAVPI